MAKLPTAPYAARIDPGNPFYIGRSVWDERIGSAREQAKNWRLAAILSLALSVFLAAGIVYTASTIRTYPYVIEVAESGQVRTVGKLVAPTLVIPDQVKMYLVKQWITNLRSLSFDPLVVRQNLEEAWEFAGARVRPMIRPHIDALAKNAALPEKDARRKAITVTIHTVLPVTENSYRIDWTEKTVNAFGQEEGTDKFAATVMLKDHEWSIYEDITRKRDKHPLGVFAHDLSWTRVVP